jgi:putative transposase
VSAKRLTATDRVRNEIEDLFADPDRELGEVLEEVAQLECAVGVPVRAGGRGHRVPGPRPSRPWRACPGRAPRLLGRHGQVHCRRAITLARPKVRGTLEKFSSRLLGKHVTKTNALESLVISGWVRGLSDRDIEAALREALGPGATISKSTVSRICERIKDEFAVWRTRDLSDIELDYLYVDASQFKMHDGARSEPVLVAYGITTEGNPVFLHLDGANAESTDACVDFLEDMVARGLGTPVLVISGGAPGLWPHSTSCFLTPDGRGVCCTAHGTPSPRCRRSTKTRYVATTGTSSISVTTSTPATPLWPRPAAVHDSSNRPGAGYPGAVTCVTDGFDELVAHLHYPRAHWPRIRHSNLISSGPSGRPAAE